MDRGKKRKPEKVYLNVYDLMENSIAEMVGFGAYHSGVEIGSTEWTFSQSGVFNHPPKGASQLQSATPGQSCKFKQRIELGDCFLSYHEIQDVISQLKSSGFSGDKYDVMTRNCNHFSDALSKALLESKKSVIPGWVNRGANIGGKIGGLFGKKTQEKVEVTQKVQRFQGNGRVLAETTETTTKKGWFFSRWFGGGKEEAPTPVKEMTPEELRKQRLAKLEAQ